MSEWQNSGDWKDWFEITGADGVDFVPFSFFMNKNNEIYQSFTKEEFFSASVYPRSPYKFYKIINGEKYYVEIQKAPQEKRHEIDVDICLEWCEGFLTGGHYTGHLSLNGADFEEFREDPKDFLDKYDYWDELTFVVDDYDINKTGPIDDVKWTER